MPPEVSWFSVHDNKKDSGLSLNRPYHRDVKRMINAAENKRDRVLISALFEKVLRPGELLTMKVGSVTSRTTTAS
ncbi:MAG: hypothetical protein ACP5JW_05175 [Candidatus Bathyarchaeia archaeon]